MIRAVVADDHALIRQAVRAMLEMRGDVCVVAEAAHGLEAVDQVEKTQPDLLVLDAAMPHLNGIRVLERLRARGSAVIMAMISMYAEAALAAQFVRWGGGAYLLKTTLASELNPAIDAALRGGVFISPALSARLSETPVITPDERLLNILTARQREFLRCVVEGRSLEDIAALLAMPPGHISTLRDDVMRHLGAPDAPALSAAAWRLRHRLMGIE